MVVIEKGEFFFGEVVGFQGYGEDVLGGNVRFDRGFLGLMDGGKEVEVVLLLLFAAVYERLSGTKKDWDLTVRFALRILDAGFLDILLAKHVSIPSIERLPLVLPGLEVCCRESDRVMRTA